DPHEQLNLHDRIFHAQQNKSNQRNTGHAVSLKAVSAGTDRIAGIVAGAISDNAGVAGIVFLNFEYDLHQVRTNVRDLGENAAGDAQRCGAQRFADRKPNEARPRVITRDEKQNYEHHQQLDADQHHADAHAGFEWNAIDRIRFTAQARERGTRVGKRIHADSKPCNSVAARNSHHAEKQDDDHANRFIFQQQAEVQHDHDGDKAFEKKQKLALRDEIRLASFIDQFGDFPHRAMNRQILQ